MNSDRNRLKALFVGAAMAGAAHASVEALLVVNLGALWVENPGFLVAVGVVSGGLIWGVVGAIAGGIIFGECVGAGVLGAALAIGLTEAGLGILTDPAPYQDAGWWVNSPLAALVVLTAAACAIWIPRWRIWAGYIWALPLLIGLPLANVDWLVHVNGVMGHVLRPDPHPPNVLLVTVDTARGDHVGAAGYSRDTTPNFDAMAEEGVRFDAAYAQIPVTGPSHLTILSGVGPWAHRTLLNGVSVPSDLPLLAERLSFVGYETGAFVSAFVLDGAFGFSRGFRVYDDDFSRLHGAAGFLFARVSAALTRRFVDSHVVERSGEDTVDLALSWLAAQESAVVEAQEGLAPRPWFLWVHLFDPHGPYEPPPPFDTRFHAGDPKDPSKTSMQAVKDVAPYLKDHLEGVTDVDWVVGRYDGELAYADAQLGRLLGALEEMGQEEHTIVVVAGDHGESLGEHDVWFNHGGDLYGAVSRVPLAMRWPEALPRARVVDAPVELTDIAPTLYDLLGLPLLGEGKGESDFHSGPWQGNSEGLSGLWQGSEGPGFARSMCFDRAANRAARELDPGSPPKWRVVALRGPHDLYVHRESGENEMWSVTVEDTGKLMETQVIEPNPALVENLQSVALDLLEAGPKGVSRAALPLSDDARQRLEALGYVE